MDNRKAAQPRLLLSLHGYAVVLNTGGAAHGSATARQRNEKKNKMECLPAEPVSVFSHGLANNKQLKGMRMHISAGVRGRFLV